MKHTEVKLSKAGQDRIPSITTSIIYLSLEGLSNIKSIFLYQLLKERRKVTKCSTLENSIFTNLNNVTRKHKEAVLTIVRTNDFSKVYLLKI